MFGPDRPFYTWFVGKARSLPKSGAGASLWQPTALLANIRLDWKALPGTNTSTDYKHLQITAAKSFITLHLECTGSSQAMVKDGSD